MSCVGDTRSVYMTFRREAPARGLKGSPVG
jgi:hypothetical protein